MEHKSKYQKHIWKVFLQSFPCKRVLDGNIKLRRARRYAARLNKTADYKAGIEVCALCDTFLIYTYEYKEKI